MEKNSLEGQTNNEEIMNRVNQTFDKLAQDVKEMVQNNNDETDDNNQYS
jgi:hypothetical protein